MKSALLCCVTIALVLSLPAAEFFVDAARPDDSGDGRSVAAAKRTLQAAVDAAAAGDTVTVLPGVYDAGGGAFAGTSGASRVVIDKPLALRSRDGQAVTHIVGRHAAGGCEGLGEGAVRCLYVPRAVKGVTVTGFTLRDGATRFDANGAELPQNKGGGVCYGGELRPGADLTVTDCVISNCVATRGGGMFGGSAVRTTFRGNTATANGGAVRETQLKDCRFDGMADGHDLAWVHVNENPGLVTDISVCGRQGGVWRREGEAYAFAFDTPPEWAPAALVTLVLDEVVTPGTLTLNGVELEPEAGKPWVFDLEEHFLPKRNVLRVRGKTVPARMDISVKRREIPRVWTSYSPIKGIVEDAKDLKAHGVELIEVRAVSTVDDCRRRLAALREAGLFGAVEVAEVTEKQKLVRDCGEEVVPAVMLGGAYRGLALDKSLFRFEAKRHSIVIEPPVYAHGFMYPRSHSAADGRKAQEPMGHYFNGVTGPVRAEVVVPLRPFDGRQHLKIVPATVKPAAKDAKLEVDTVKEKDRDLWEVRHRRLYEVSFDLTGLDGAMLDKVGLAVYWETGDQDDYWMFQHGQVAPAAESTRRAMRKRVQELLGRLALANGGAFPKDVIRAVRIGDECFNLTGHPWTKDVNFPLWDFSAPGIAAYERRTGGALAYPRVWGHPEIYGERAYAQWLYSYHERCASLLGVARRAAHEICRELIVYRNTTRGGPFSRANDFDGTAQELDARNLDIVHLDPYPVTAKAYNSVIPVDMAYCGGLARRLGKPLIPWMQAHCYLAQSGGLVDVTPEQVDRMAGEQRVQGIDGVVWLGYGPSTTFPLKRPDSWERAGAFHRELHDRLPPKPKAAFAAVREYGKWAAWREDAFQKRLIDFSVKEGGAYDVFEVPPDLTEAERAELERELKAYPKVLRQ